MPTPSRTNITNWALVIVALGIVGVGVLVPKWDIGVGPQRLVLWVSTGLLLLAAAWIIGKASKPGPWGWLVDERNRMSLGRLQALVWTMLIASALYTAAVTNIASPVRVPCSGDPVPPAPTTTPGAQTPAPTAIPTAPATPPSPTLAPTAGPGSVAKLDAGCPLQIDIPAQLLLAMGISLGGFGLSRLALNSKEDVPADESEADQTLGNQSPSTLSAPGHGHTRADKDTLHEGVIVRNAEPTDASLSELFMGEEVGNLDKLDIGKLQMAFFTLTLVVSYGSEIWRLFSGNRPFIDGLPPLDQGMVNLLALSHGGYVGNKLLPHSARDSLTAVDVQATPAPNDQQWNNTQQVVVLLAAHSPGGPAASAITWSKSGAEVSPPVTAVPPIPITVSIEGSTAITYFASSRPDTARVYTVNIDRTPPTVSAPADKTVDATAQGKTRVDFAAPTATDKPSGIASIVCNPESGSLFDIGKTQVTITATDLAGNPAQGIFNVVVRGVPEQLKSLADELRNSATGATPAAGANAAAAIAADFDPSNPTAVCARLDDLRTQLAGMRSGNPLSDAVADDFVKRVEQVKRVAGCP